MAWADIFSKIAEKKPIIHCITNIVTVNDCANVLLAIGASPVMAHHEMEVKEILPEVMHWCAIWVRLRILKQC